MSAPDVRVYLVGGDVGAGRTLSQVAAAAVAGGATMVQLRVKSADTRTVCDAVSELTRGLEARDLTVPVIVNDDPCAAHESSAAGVHLGPDDPHPQLARELLGPHAVVGWSIHDADQLGDSAAVEACDYLAASPVWPTPSKPDTTAALGLEGVASLRAAMPPAMPLVAIGGIDESNAAEVVTAGADGVAVVSAICAAADPERAARRLRDAVDAALLRRRGREGGADEEESMRRNP